MIYLRLVMSGNDGADEGSTVVAKANHRFDCFIFRVIGNESHDVKIIRLEAQLERLDNPVWNWSPAP
jgi:hypothetical protein